MSRPLFCNFVALFFRSLLAKPDDPDRSSGGLITFKNKIKLAFGNVVWERVELIRSLPGLQSWIRIMKINQLFYIVNGVALVACSLFLLHQVRVWNFFAFFRNIDDLKQVHQSTDITPVLYNLKVSDEDMSLKTPTSFKQQEKEMRSLFRTLGRQTKKMESKEAALKRDSKDFAESVKQQVHMN